MTSSEFSARSRYIRRFLSGVASTKKMGNLWNVSQTMIFAASFDNLQENLNQQPWHHHLYTPLEKERAATIIS